MKNATQRTTTAVAVASVLALGLAGCVGQGGPNTASGGDGSAQVPAEFCASQNADPTGVADLVKDESITADLKFWGWYNIVPQAVLDDFHEIYPNINVEFTDFNTSDTHTKLATSLAGGSGAPDMSMVQDRDAPRFYDLPLLDLSECLAPYKDTFPEFKWDKITTPAGNQQAVPWEADAGVLVYRTDLFDEYGIDPSSIETWDDYIAAGEKIDEASGGKTKMLMSLPIANDNGIAGHVMSDFNMMLNEQGGQYFNEDGEPALASPEGERALDLIREFREAGITLNDVASGQAEKVAFENDEVATILQQASVSFGLKGSLADMSGKWGVMPLPAFDEGGTRGAIRGGTSLAIPAQSTNPEAAWKFLEFWLLRVDSRWTNYETGGLVENLFLPAAEDPRFTAGDDYFGGQPFLQIVIDSAREAPQFNENIKTNQLESSFKQNVRDFLAGEGDSSSLLETVANETKQAQ
ncbi:sugar ABC transporter substrate-binding protein [Salinibacterium sp. TMP30]|uniref:ABC transporter substrate-binding protein n=1 Tax=Salinibacterium sp. TMP30 TaxID=3138237 RepID=UPI0031398EF9